MAIKIIHIEENETDRDALKNLFREANILCRISSFSTQLKAIEHLTKISGSEGEKPNLVVTGCIASCINGFPIAEFMNSVSTYNNIPLVTLSFFATEANINQAFQQGVCSFLTKPINKEKMHHLLELMICN